MSSGVLIVQRPKGGNVFALQSTPYAPTTFPPFWRCRLQGMLHPNSSTDPLAFHSNISNYFQPHLQARSRTPTAQSRSSCKMYTEIRIDCPAAVARPLRQFFMAPPRCLRCDLRVLPQGASALAWGSCWATPRLRGSEGVRWCQGQVQGIGLL